MGNSSALSHLQNDHEFLRISKSRRHLLYLFVPSFLVFLIWFKVCCSIVCAHISGLAHLHIWFEVGCSFICSYFHSLSASFGFKFKFKFKSFRYLCPHSLSSSFGLKFVAYLFVYALISCLSLLI